MSIREFPRGARLALVALRWAARLASLASIGVLALFATSGGGMPRPFEWLLLACFPIGVVIGMLAAWRHEIGGGVVTAVSLVVFYGLMFVRDGQIPTTPWFAVLAGPGLVLLVVGLAWRGLASRSVRA
ncbi:MAG: hypothetical protein SFZ24_11415 [Planctomycetota bacterium]|nr:hypothetical protein [Planctomycetota bacterium]